MSTTLNSIGYDHADRALELEYSNGDIYRYFDVPQETYADFMLAESKAIYLNTIFKTYGFEYRKL
jgi:hypothetical protein